MPKPPATSASSPAITPLTLAVMGAAPGTRVEVIPGKTYISLPPEAVETMALFELKPAGDGTMRPVARICSRFFTVTKKNLKSLHIAISDQGIARLIRAGFVSGGPVTPGVWQFDYFSYLRHEQAVLADPEEFWARKEPGQLLTNIARYRASV